MAFGKYEIPAEYKDEDRWWKFTKRQLVYVGLAAGLDYLFFCLLSPFGLIFPIILIDVFITLFLLAIALIPMPSSMYLYGGGMMLETILLRLILRRMNRVIYTKNYDEKENC